MQFLYPDLFYIILAPLLLLILLMLTNKENMQRYFNKSVLDKLSVNNSKVGKKFRNILFFLTLILFVVALARPVIDQKEQELKQNLIPIVIALDVSKSMMASDIYPNRISLAKKKLKSIINYAKNSTVGILLFAKDSFILSPVTEDFISLNYIIENLDTNLDFTNGSNIEAVLEATSHMLSEFKVKNLIILSDGGNDNNYDEALDFAKENDIVIYSVGVATKNGAPIPQENGYLTDKNGNIVTVKLNESIKNLALNSGGGYIDFSLDDTDIQAIINKINQDSQKEELNTQKIKTYTELFYYPLALALFILFLALSSFPNFRAKQTVKIALFTLVFSIYTPTLEASIFEFETIKKADELYKQEKYKEATQEYKKISKTPQSNYNLANSLYKDKKYDEAIKAYEEIITDDKNLEYKKLHNIGNSYVKSNNLEKAKEFYEKALQLKEDKQTKENLEMVKKELEKQKKKEDQNKQDKKNQDKKDSDKKDQQSDDKKDQKNKKDEQKDQGKNGQKSDDKKDDKKSAKKNKKPDDKQNQDKKDQNKKNSKASSANQDILKKQNISDMEEKKWMKILKDKKTPILLQKVDAKNNTNSDESQPW